MCTLHTFSIAAALPQNRTPTAITATPTAINAAFPATPATEAKRVALAASGSCGPATRQLLLRFQRTHFQILQGVTTADEAFRDAGGGFFYPHYPVHQESVFP